MEEITNYINSKDIAEYLRNLDYRFNSLEAAWLIYQCRRLTLEEKHCAWKNLIQTMPDCEIPSRCNCIYQRSLHEFLKKYMAIEKSSYALFLKEGGELYTCELNCMDSGTWGDVQTIFLSLDACWGYVDRLLEDESNKIELVTIKKFKPNIEYPILTASFDSCRKLIQIKDRTLVEEELEIMTLSFAGMWFDFPTPFEKGDILICPYRLHDPKPFILNDLIIWNCPDYVRKDGDNSDMCAGYVGINEAEGTFFVECGHGYVDFEYYCEPLKGVYRLFQPLSNLMKGKIPIPLAFNAFRKILLEEFSKESWMQGWFGEAAYRDAGLKE